MRNKYKNILLGIAAMAFILIMDWHCPFQKVFGIPCPGCNMTTAFYQLLHGHFQLSLWYHAMLIPTGIGIIVIMFFPEHKTKILWIWAILMLLYYVFRMLFVFPQAPMVYDENCLLELTLKIIGL